MQQPKPAFYRKTDGGYMRPVYKHDALKKLADSVPGKNEGDRSYGLSLLILQHCFGFEWLEKHVLDEPTNGFLGRHVDGSDYGASVVMHRIRDLAEMVVNLSQIGGVEAPFEQIASGQIESGYAELEAGRLLSWAALSFRFIWASGIAGHDFDIEVKFPNGMAVCVDTKCKTETGFFSSKGIRNTLDIARKKNLPKGHPGAIIIKVPDYWLESAETMNEIEETCLAFFRGTRRIVTISIFASKLERRAGMMNDWHMGCDFTNPSHDYEEALNWRLFSYTQEQLLSPCWWMRLTSFFTASP